MGTIYAIDEFPSLEPNKEKMANIMSNSDIKEAAEERLSEIFQISRETFKNRSRRREVVRARFALWLMLYEVYKETYTSIGGMYGYDHTTIRHGVQIAKSGDLCKILGITC